MEGNSVKSADVDYPDDHADFNGPDSPRFVFVNGTYAEER